MSAEQAADKGLASQQQAVEAARAQLGQDLDRLVDETGAQVRSTVERIVWKLAAGGAGALAALVVVKGLKAGWRATHRGDPPENPAAPSTSWGDALLWTAVTAAAAAVAKVAAARGAAAGWQKATGAPPPGLES